MFKIILNSILGVVLIIVWSRFVDLPQIAATLSKVRLAYLVPIFFFMLVSPLLRAVRLKVILSKVRKLSLLDLIWLNGAALMLNFFIPIRAGEFAKAVYLNTNYQLNLGKAVVWIFLDRFIDFLVVLVLAAILLFLVPTSLSAEGAFGITFIIIITVIPTLSVAVTYLAVFKKDFAKKLVNFLKPLLIVSSIKIYFERLVDFILESFSILDRHPKDLILIIFITVLAYAADAAIWYFTFIALGAGQDFLKMYLGQVLSALTYLIPAAPGYVGSAEASGLLILSGAFGLSPNLASAMIVLFHVLTVIFVLIFGIISLYFIKLNLGQILNKLLNRR